jgi:hypothetical protein
VEKVFENVLISEADDLIAEYIEDNNIDVDKEIIEEDDEHQLWQCMDYIYVPELNIKIHNCLYCSAQKDEETGEITYEGDFTGWIFRDSVSNKIVYNEGYSSLCAAISNGFNGNFNTLRCDIYV